MSNVVLTALPGLTWDVKMRPSFATNVQTALSGKEIRLAFMQYPLWQYELTYNVLREVVSLAELQYLVGFFLQRQGKLDNWLFDNPRDRSVADYQFALCDGVTTQFQLTRTYGGFVEPVQSVNVITNLKSNGSTITNPADYTISTTGLVTLTAAGTNGHALTWTGTYYTRVRFTEDMLEFNNFMYQLWELRKMAFQSVKL